MILFVKNIRSIESRLTEKKIEKKDQGFFLKQSFTFQFQFRTTKVTEVSLARKVKS